MTIAALDQEYKDLYKSEISRRDFLNQATDRPVAIITAFGGVLYFCVSHLQHPLSPVALFQLLLASVALLAILAAVYFIIRSYWNHTYGYVPTPLELSAYRKTLEKYYSDHELVPPENLDTMVLSHIYESYVRERIRTLRTIEYEVPISTGQRRCLLSRRPSLFCLG